MRRLPLITIVIALVVVVSPARADTPPPIPANANWLTTVNFYRAMAGLPAVTENSSWTAGEINHSRYVAENGQPVHAEDPNNFYYTASGNEAGQNGNVAYSSGPGVTCPDRQMVETWMAGPFHAIGILDPRLQTSAYGSYISQDNNPGNQCGATLDVLRGLSGSTTSVPRFFPGNGMTTPLLSYNGGESPDPLAGCSGYTVPTGPPIFLLLPTSPGAATITLRDNGAVVPSCQVSPSDPLLTTRNAIAIMPRNPYTSGHNYSVDIQIGATTYSWSFMACAAGQTGGSCNLPTAVTLRAASAVRTRAGVVVRWRTASETNVVGFNVYRGAVKVNRALIPSVFGGAASGHRYSWTDRTAPRSAATLRYRLQAVHLDGTRSWLAKATVR